MKLQVDLQDLRYMLKEKCDDIIADPKLAHEFFDRICEIEEDQRFEEVREGRWVPLTGMAPPEYHGHKICSLCECFAPYDPLHMGHEVLTKYCPGCGAEMENGTDD